MATIKEEKEFVEPEEKIAGTDTVETIVDGDMLTEEPVIERTHTGTGKAGPTVNEWQVPPLSENPPPPPVDEEPQGPTGPYVNDELKDIPHKDKKEMAFEFAGIIIDGYEQGCTELGNMTLLISERRAEKLHRKGEIDLNIQVAIKGGGAMTMRSFIGEFNDKMANVIQPDPEFKEKVQPMLAEELAKRNAVLTNMQMLLLYTGLDLVKKGKAFKEGFLQRADMLDTLKTYTHGVKTGQINTMPSATASAPVNTTVTPPTEQEVSPAPPSPVTQVFDTTSANAFDDIQSGRGGGSIIPSNAAPNIQADLHRMHVTGGKKRGRPPGRKNKSKK